MARPKGRWVYLEDRKQGGEQYNSKNKPVCNAYAADCYVSRPQGLKSV